MVTQRKPKASKYLTTPTRPVQVDRDRSVAGLLEKMEGTGFGGRQLAEAHRIWLDMLGDNTTIMVAASDTKIMLQTWTLVDLHQAIPLSIPGA